MIKFSEEHPFGYEPIIANKWWNRSIHATRNAMAYGADDDTLRDLPIYAAPSPIYSHVLLDDESKPKMMAIDKHNNVINSHEYGHVIDFDKPNSRKLNFITAILGPSESKLYNLYSEARANKKSWEALNKAYKDAPGILNDYSYLRRELLTPAYKTYVYSNTPGIALGLTGSVAGGILGYKYPLLRSKLLSAIAGKQLFDAAGYRLGNAMAGPLGFNNAQINALNEIQYKLNDRDIQYRLNNLNNKIISHAIQHNYYE